MCGRFSLATTPEVLSRQFELAELPDLEPHYNVAPTQPVPVVRVGRGPAPREMVLMRWGLVPPWSKDLSVGGRFINARAETVGVLAAFKDAFAHRRCLIPATGFYEWHQAGGVKQPYWLHPPDAEVMAFAGLWERWRAPDDTWLLSCSIVTTAANDYVATLHDRMPALIAPDDYARWLDTRAELDDVQALLNPAQSAALEAVPVSTRVNKVQNDAPDLLEPVGPPLPHW